MSKNTKAPGLEVPGTLLDTHPGEAAVALLDTELDNHEGYTAYMQAAAMLQEAERLEKLSAQWFSKLGDKVLEFFAVRREYDEKARAVRLWKAELKQTKLGGADITEKRAGLGEKFSAWLEEAVNRTAEKDPAISILRAELVKMTPRVEALEKELAPLKQTAIEYRELSKKLTMEAEDLLASIA
jgi:hypothetical protein